MTLRFFLTVTTVFSLGCTCLATSRTSRVGGGSPISAFKMQKRIEAVPSAKADPEEIKKAEKKHLEFINRLKKADVNKDGAIDANEIGELRKSKEGMDAIKEADLNHDGIIDAKEMQNAGVPNKKDVKTSPK